MNRLLVSVILALPATADAGELDLALTRMTTTTGPAYIDARTQVIAFGQQALRSRVDAALWGAATWETDAAAAAALAWIEHTEECARVYALDGLVPTIYLARRRPGPEVGRELRRLRDVGPILHEALTRSLHQLSTPADFPEGYGARAEQLIAAERAALRVGLLAALGRCGHPLAPFSLARVALDTGAPEGERRAAAIALGEAGGEVADLMTLAADASLSRRLRAGAVIGIAKASRAHPHASLDALRACLADPVLQRPAISGLAIAGASWGDRSTARNQLRAEVALILTRELGRDGSHEGALLEALSVVDHPATREHLQSMLRDGAAPAVRARVERALTRVRPGGP